MEENKSKGYLGDTEMRGAHYEPPCVKIILLAQADIITASGEYDAESGDNTFDYESMW